MHLWGKGPRSPMMTDIFNKSYEELMSQNGQFTEQLQDTDVS